MGKQMTLSGLAVPQRTEEWLATPEGAACWAKMQTLALRLGEANRPFGVRMIAETARYDLTLKASAETDLNKFKVNNDFVPYLSRKLKKRYPHLAHLIRQRRVVWEEEVA